MEKEFEDRVEKGIELVQLQLLISAKESLGLSKALVRQERVLDVILGNIARARARAFLEEWRKFTNCYYFGLYTPLGKLIIHTVNYDEKDIDFYENPLLKVIISGEKRASYGLEVYQDRLLASGVASIYSWEIMCIGMIKSSIEIAQEDIERLKQASGFDIRIELPNARVLSTFPEGEIKESDFKIRKFFLKDLAKQNIVPITIGFPIKFFVEANTRTQKGVIVLTIIFILIGIVIAVSVTNMIIGPLQILTKGAAIVGKGDLTHRVKIKSRDELGQLADSFNKMTEDLQRTTTSIESLNKEITERTKAEESLRKSEERFKKVAESAQEWIWEVNADGLYTYSSPVVEIILGYKPEEVVGKKYFYDFFAPEVKEKLKKAAFETFAKREGFKKFINPNLHKNGSIAILQTSGFPILDSKGNLRGYRGTDTDITERRKAEKEQRRLIKDLEETNKIMVGRELRMVELKKKINELSKELSRPEPYDMSSLES